MESVSWVLLIPSGSFGFAYSRSHYENGMRMPFHFLCNSFQTFPLSFQLCVWAVSWLEALTPELAASGGGCGCRTCDIVWFSAVSWHVPHFWSQMKTLWCWGCAHFHWEVLALLWTCKFILCGVGSASALQPLGLRATCLTARVVSLAALLWQNIDGVLVSGPAE